MKVIKYKLGELLRVTRGASLPGTGYADSGMYLRLTLANFHEVGGFKEFKSTQGKYFVEPFDSRFLMRKGDLITPLTEQSPGLLGSVAFVPCDGLYIQSQDIGLISCNPERLDKRFAYYLFLTHSVRDQISARSQQTKIRHTSPDKIADVEVYLPDLPTQLRIAGVLGSIDEKIELNRKKIAELEALAKTIYDYWFVQFDFPDANGKPYKSSGGKMVWNEQLKREVPEGWDVKRLPEIADYLFGYPFDSSLFNDKGNGFPIVRIRNVKDGVTQDSTTESANKEYIISDGDFLIGMDGYFDMNHWIGGDAYLVQRTCRIKTKQSLYAGWLSSALQAPIKHLEKSLSGATLAHLGKAHLDEIMLPVPPDDMRQVLSILNQAIERKVTLGSENMALTQQRDTLLPLLMNGQVLVG